MYGMYKCINIAYRCYFFDDVPSWPNAYVRGGDAHMHAENRTRRSKKSITMQIEYSSIRSEG